MDKNAEQSNARREIMIGDIENFIAQQEQELAKLTERAATEGQIEAATAQKKSN